MIVVTIIATIAAVAVPNYVSALGIARIRKAKSELKAIQSDILTYQSKNAGLPPSLAVLGRREWIDPWGNPYVYLPYLPITLVGASIPPQVAGGGGPPGLIRGRGAPPPGPGGGGVSIGVGGIALTSEEITAMINSTIAPPDLSDQMRRDRNMLPLNSDFDLFSIGPDRQSMPSITALVSLDDVIRADDGGFFGLAKDY
jgi:general secretion pathway protein G